MKILIVGINYAPEPIGIGPYTADMAKYFADKGASVSVVAAKPYYPRWKVPADYETGLFRRTVEAGVRVTRCMLYVPENPTGLRRIIHHLSFLLMAFIPVMLTALRRRPDVVIAVAPSLMTAPLARFAARLVGAKSWLHVQDFEVEAAFATGLVSGNSLAARLALKFQSYAFAGFDRYSSISAQMCAKVERLLKRPARIIEMRNWSDFVHSKVKGDEESPYRAQWSLEDKHVALYSGNVSRKQGVDIILEAARRLRHRDDLQFVICGQGPEMVKMIASATDLPNVKFEMLQPRERLGELLSLASVHLLPQIKGAADLVLPSKLTNMLASGRPVIATAQDGTGLALETEGCGLVTPPGDVTAFAGAIETLLDSSQLRESYGASARSRARERWSKQSILASLERELTLMCAKAPKDIAIEDIQRSAAP